MKIAIARSVFTERTTSGTISCDGVPVCVSLEDRIRAPGVKVPGQTAIPPGRYQVIVSWSERFKRELPLLLDVPMFRGIRIHPGNTAADTEGCILVGIDRGDDQVFRSREAFGRLFPRIVAAVAREKVWIEIANIAPPAFLLEVS